MNLVSWILGKFCAGVIASLTAASVLAVSATAASRVTWIDGTHPKSTPANLNRVGVLKVGPRSARNVLILEPGSGAGAAKLVPLARALVKELPRWQVWSVERRENRLEDQSVLNQAKRGRASPQKVFDYYLRWTTDESIADHVQPLRESQVGFARRWGLAVEVNDLRHVVNAAANGGRRVVLGGHSLGAAITTAYATWDFNGEPGVEDLSGLVFSDGGSSVEPITAPAARALKRNIETSSPWADEGDLTAPFSGLAPDVGAALAKLDPNGPSLLQGWSAWPSPLKPAVAVTNEALFGFDFDTESSPLVTLWVHAGHLAETGDPRPWVRVGEITPIGRYVNALFGSGLLGTDGTIWYQPARTFIDSLAIANGKRNTAQRVLGVRATHGDDIDVPIYAFATSYGDGFVLDSARDLAERSSLPTRDLTLVDRSASYAHGDPNYAYPKNAFAAHLVPFLKRIARR